MDNLLNIKLCTTAKDFKAMAFFNLFLRRRGFLIFLIVGAVCSIAAIIGRLSRAVMMANWYFAVCIAFLGLILLQYILFELSVKRFLSSDRLVVDNERTVTISKEGIFEEGGRENSTGSYGWDLFYIAYETKQYFFLYINTMQAIVLPKRYFSPQEITFLEMLVKEKMGQKFRKR